MAKCTLSSVALFCSSVACGVATLFAYNSFFASPSYLEKYYQFAAVKNADDIRTLPFAKLSVWRSITTWSTVLQSIPMFLMQIVMLTPWMLGINVKWRIIGSAGALLVSELLLPACSASGGLSERSSLTVLFIACIFSGLSTCVLQSSCFAFFGTLPTLYVLGFIFGSGLSGSINSILRIIIAVSLPTTFHGVKTGATIFFTIGMVLMFLTILIAYLLEYNSIVVQYSSAYQRKNTASKYKSDDAPNDENNHSSNNNKNNNEEVRMSATDKNNTDNNEALVDEAGAVRSPIGPNEISNEGDSKEHGMSSETTRESSLLRANDNERESKKTNAFTVIRKIWPMMLCCGFNMFVSLLLFPGIGLKAMHWDKASSTTSTSTSLSSSLSSSTTNSTNSTSLKSDDNGANYKPEAIMPMVVVLMFNLGDTVGRGLTNSRKLWLSKRNTVILVVARAIIAIIPLILGVIPAKIINSDVNPIVVFFFLGCTGGYIIGVTMGYGNSDERLESEDEHATAGTCMCFSLLFGITIGSVVSLLLLNFAFDQSETSAFS